MVDVAPSKYSFDVRTNFTSGGRITFAHPRSGVLTRVTWPLLEQHLCRVQLRCVRVAIAANTWADNDDVSLASRLLVLITSPSRTRRVVRVDFDLPPSLVGVITPIAHGNMHALQCVVIGVGR